MLKGEFRPDCRHFGNISNESGLWFSLSAGLLVLEDLQQEDVVLACTLPRSWALPPPTTSPEGASPSSTPTPTSPSPSQAPSSADKPVFLEMDADSKFLLTRPLASREAEARFFKTPLLRRVLSHCRERADIWSSQIKVTHHVFPVPDTTPSPKAGLQVGPMAGLVVAASNASSGPVASTASGSTRASSEHRAIHGLFRVGARDSALGGKASSLSSGGTKKSQSFRCVTWRGGAWHGPSAAQAGPWGRAMGRGRHTDQSIRQTSISVMSRRMTRSTESMRQPGQINHLIKSVCVDKNAL